MSIRSKKEYWGWSNL